MKRTDLPRGVFEQDGRYYLVTAAGKRRIWTPLTRIKEGLPALYTALAAARTDAAECVRMPALIAAWQIRIGSKRSEKTQIDDRARARVIAEAFPEFLPAQMKAPACLDFLEQFEDKPRTFNAYRALLREFMRFAEVKGLREAGSNPVIAIKQMPTPARGRYITDDELAKIKAAALVGRDGLDTRSGAMLCCLIDMAYLTGQRIGDLLSMEWSQITDAGIEFVTGKTGARIMVERTARLDAVVQTLRELRIKRAGFAPQVFTRQDGQAYTYWGASTAWQRARERAGVSGCTFHDIRAKALTDVQGARGMDDAQRMGGHSTPNQTADYVRHKTARKTGATK